MMRNQSKWIGVVFTLSAAVVLLSGCGQTPSGQGGAAVNPAEAAPEATAGADHSGWWCVEHGVPEEICTRCSTQLAVDFQKQGDWCPAHRRPDSQCFICHPELAAKFAAQYEAKLGHRPPPPSE